MQKKEFKKEKRIYIKKRKTLEILLS